jgi:thioredoxin 1
MIAVKEVARERAGMLKVGIINVEQEKMLAGRFGVLSVPKLVLFRNGAIVDEINGAPGKRDLDAWLEHY